MTVMLRVAHRQDGRTTIQSTDEHAEFFTLGAMFDISYSNKKLIIKKDATGLATCRVPTSYQHEGITRMVYTTCLDSWIPGFAVDFAEFEIVGDSLVWDRPPVWMLAWGSAAPRANARDLAMKGFRMRLASCLRNHGNPQFVTQAASKSWAPKVLQPGDFMAVVKEFYPNGSRV